MATTDTSAPTEPNDDTTVLRVIYPRARGRLTLRGGGAGLD